MQQKIFVFGGKGNAGKFLLKHLSTMPGVTVVATSRDPNKAPSYPNVKWIKADPKDRKTYIEDMKGCGVVMSLLGS
jgi:nucleoside-diphosphate-sugar epimerase